MLVGVEGLPAVADVVVERALPGRAAWRGRAGRDPVDVSVVELPADPGVRRAALATLTPLVGPAAGPVPRCRAVVLCRDGVALIADAVDGRRIADLPPLTPGHAVAVGRPVARALAGLHARGLAWGGRFDELLVDGGGAVWLPYEGIVGRRTQGQAATAHGDVTAITRLLARRCVDPRLSALAAEPPPDAAALARRLRRLARPRSPVLAPAPAVTRPSTASTTTPVVTVSTVNPSPRSGHWLGRRTLLAAVAALALVAVGTAGWLSARPTLDRGPRAVRLARPTPDWATTVHALDAARAAALAGSRPLTTADAPGSTALAEDTATRGQIAARHLAVSPPVPALRQVAVRVQSPTSATLTVTDTLAAYDYRDTAGRLVGTEPARGPRTWTVVLIDTDEGWRLSRVT